MNQQSKIEQINLEQLSREQIKDAIQAFLDAQYDKKTKTEQKQLEKAIEDNDVAVKLYLADLGLKASNISLTATI